MPLIRHLKAFDEHQIFVKNVPADTAMDTIPNLYARYNPLDVKNVYPNGRITTVVVSFRNKQDALRAQQETDGTRLDNVVLRVEMYNKRQSVRYLRDNGIGNRPFGAAPGKDEVEVAEDSTQDVALRKASSGALVAAKGPNEAPEGFTWAHAAANKPPPATTKAPPALKDDVPEAPVVPSGTPVDTPHTQVAVPCEAAVEGNDKPEKPLIAKKPAVSVPQATVDAWEPFDTSARIAHKHRRDCSFCQERMRR